MDPDLFVVVMGVSGSGKSTVGTALADALDLAFLEADDLHPPANVEKMAGGTPLDDRDRWPWLDRVGHDAAALVERGGVVVACSALRRAYRDVLRRHGATHLVHLRGDTPVLRDRLTGRTGHFMAADMLDSQLATLEGTDGEEDVLELDPAQPVARLVDATTSWILGAGQRSADPCPDLQDTT